MGAKLEKFKTVKEELDKFHPLKYKGNLAQASFDLFEEIEDTLYNRDLKEDDIIWSIHYNITTMMEICDKSLIDYKWLQEMLEVIDKYGA